MPSLRLSPLAASLALALLARSGSAQNIAPQADAYLNAYVAAHKFMGSVLVAKEGKPIYRKSFGWADAEWDVPNTPETKFRLGSITKQFTAAAILKLAEAGKLKLEDPVSKYYTDAPAAWSKITIHHLLNHTSGIPSYTAIPNFFSKQSMIPLRPEEIVKLTADKPLEFEPGSKFNYDNTGYILLGYIIEKITGTPYADYLRQTIFEPLGMHDTGYDTWAQVLKHRASGYLMNGTVMVNAPYLDMTLPYAAGSLYSTVDDLSIWDGALYTGKVLSSASKAKMFTPGLESYGYGFFIGQRAGRREVSHGGGINGFNTHIIRFLDDRLVSIVLSNLNTNATEKIAVDLARMAFGESVSAPATP